MTTITISRKRKLLTVFDHLCDAGPLHTVMARERYGINPRTFRCLISELRTVVQIESRPIKLNEKQYMEHRLIV